MMRTGAGTRAGRERERAREGHRGNA